ncbi:MAG TPA: sigma-70 family RNA polymerase sigma factor [Thermoanaerobaculia bacterium]
MTFTCPDCPTHGDSPERRLNFGWGIKSPESESCIWWDDARRQEELREQSDVARFEQAVLPHMDAAYNLARWLTRNDADAADVTQEAFLRALKFFGGFRGGDTRAWLLTIVRNTCYTWLRRNRVNELATPFDEEAHSGESDDPETILLEGADREMLRQALEALPVEFREVMILRELEGLSYKKIAGIADVPVGTVMSRLARARKRLRLVLTSDPEGGRK